MASEIRYKQGFTLYLRPDSSVTALVVLSGVLFDTVANVGNVFGNPDARKTDSTRDLWPFLNDYLLSASSLKTYPDRGDVRQA